MDLSEAEADEQAGFMLNVLDALKARGMTQTELAERIGVTPQLLRAWRNGTRRTPPRRVEQIAIALDMRAKVLWPGWGGISDAEADEPRTRRTAAERVAELEARVDRQDILIDYLLAEVRGMADRAAGDRVTPREMASLAALEALGEAADVSSRERRRDSARQQRGGRPPRSA